MPKQNKLLRLVGWIDLCVLVEDCLYHNLRNRLDREPSLRELKDFYLYILGDSYEQAKYFLQGLEEE